MPANTWLLAIECGNLVRLHTPLFFNKSLVRTLAHIHWSHRHDCCAIILIFIQINLFFLSFVVSNKFAHICFRIYSFFSYFNFILIAFATIHTRTKFTCTGRICNGLVVNAILRERKLSQFILPFTFDRIRCWHSTHALCLQQRNDSWWSDFGRTKVQRAKNMYFVSAIQTCTREVPLDNGFSREFLLILFVAKFCASCAEIDTSVFSGFRLHRKL